MSVCGTGENVKHDFNFVFSLVFFQNVLGEGLYDPALGQDGDSGDADVRDNSGRVGDNPRVCGSDSANPDGGLGGDYWICLYQDAGREHNVGVSAGQGELH